MYSHFRRFGLTLDYLGKGECADKTDTRVEADVRDTARVGARLKSLGEEPESPHRIRIQE